MQYIAFLRGINVGGKNIIKMEKLKTSFESLGFKNVKTFIQSGNVIFDSGSKDISALTKKIEKQLFSDYESDIKTMVRTAQEISNMVALNPFGTTTENEAAKLYVCFSYDEIKAKPELPVVSEKEACEIIAIEGMEIFVVSRRMKNGRYGFPNNFIEKEFAKFFTARNWNTIKRMIA